MKEITDNEIRFILTIFKNPKVRFNANNMSKILDISRMGCLKISKKLEKEGIINLKQLGKARFFSLNLNKDYVKHYVSFLLKREAEKAAPYLKIWINDLKEKITKAEIIILFGSVLKKGSDANDIDVMFVTTQKDFEKLKKEIEEMDIISNKKIHPVYQSIKDLKENIKKGDAVVLNVLKGVIVKGAEDIVEMIKGESNKE